MIVGRKRQDRDRVMHPGAVESLATIGARRGNEGRADILDRARQVRIPAPQNDHAMSLQRAKLLGRAERDRTAADDDHDRIARLRHHWLPLVLCFAGIRRISVANTGAVFDDPLARRAYLTGRTRTDRHLPVTARYVEHIGWLTKPGDTARS